MTEQQPEGLRPLPLFKHNCRRCGAPFETVKPHGQFCGDGCRIARNNELRLQGVRIAELALYWRQSRKREALTDLCAVLDDILARERTAGKPRRTRPEFVRARYHQALGDARMPRPTTLAIAIARAAKK